MLDETNTNATGELFAEHKAELPKEWHETFDTLTSQGKSPSGIKATIEYITTQKTQQECAIEYNVSEVTIRNLQTAAVALGPIDNRRESTYDSKKDTALDNATYVADVLGWEVGVEYSISEVGHNHRQPRLLAEGWRKLREELD